MKLKLLAALLVAAGTVSPPAAFAKASDLADCCSPGDTDFPKIGGNLGNQNYSKLRQINKGLVRKLGGAWVNRIEGGLDSGTNPSTTVVVDGVIYIESALGNVIAVDGRTGVTKWKYTTPFGAITRRGVAQPGDRCTAPRLRWTERLTARESRS